MFEFCWYLGAWLVPCVYVGTLNLIVLPGIGKTAERRLESDLLYLYCTYALCIFNKINLTNLGNIRITLKWPWTYFTVHRKTLLSGKSRQRLIDLYVRHWISDGCLGFDKHWSSNEIWLLTVCMKSHQIKKQDSRFCLICSWRQLSVEHDQLGQKERGCEGAGNCSRRTEAHEDTKMYRQREQN